ncbi:hypothetical protein KII91_07160, partial [Leuconostoc gelidum subsp. gelidum]|uniref:hypothetical protein n=1 Tax=Leuconostoc gelidum TaxID=1244 RepID=UPI001CC74169
INRPLIKIDFNSKRDWEFPKQKHINIDVFLPQLSGQLVCSQQELLLVFKLSLKATSDTIFSSNFSTSFLVECKCAF